MESTIAKLIQDVGLPVAIMLICMYAIAKGWKYYTSELKTQSERHRTEAAEQEKCHRIEIVEQEKRQREENAELVNKLEASYKAQVEIAIQCNETIKMLTNALKEK